MILDYSLAAIDYIGNVNKQGPDSEAIYKYISRTETLNVNKSTDELVKQSVAVNKKTIQVMAHFFHTMIL